MKKKDQVNEGPKPKRGSIMGFNSGQAKQFRKGLSMFLTEELIKQQEDKKLDDIKENVIQARFE